MSLFKAAIKVQWNRSNQEHTCRLTGYGPTNEEAVDGALARLTVRQRSEDKAMAAIHDNVMTKPAILERTCVEVSTLEAAKLQQWESLGGVINSSPSVVSWGQIALTSLRVVSTICYGTAGVMSVAGNHGSLFLALSLVRRRRFPGVQVVWMSLRAGSTARCGIFGTTRMAGTRGNPSLGSSQVSRLLLYRVPIESTFLQGTTIVHSPIVYSMGSVGRNEPHSVGC